jgi:uncharacterized protein
VWKVILLVVVVCLVWGAAHAYVGWSLGRFVRNSRRRHALWTVLAVSFVITLSAALLRRSGLPEAILDPLQRVNFLLMGAFTLLWSLVVLRDLGYLVARLIRRVVSGPDEDDQPTDLGRRTLFHNTLNTGLMGAAVVGTGYGYRQARKVPPVVEIDVPVEGLAAELDGLRIAQISDTHIGPTLKGDFLEAVVERVNAARPDLITFTGDMVDGYVDDMRAEIAAIADLDAPLGVYWVTGNHEYYWDGPAWCDEVERHGVSVLVNAHRVVDVGSARLLVGGVTDFRAGRDVDGHSSDPHRAIEGAPACDFKLLLAHQPKSVWEAAEAGFDLQLSGHTHGGQFWPWNLVVGLAHPFSRGLHDYEQMKIYVSCGTGYWGPPMRLGVPSEIGVLTLRRV